MLELFERDPGSSVGKTPAHELSLGEPLGSEALATTSISSHVAVTESGINHV